MTMTTNLHSNMGSINNRRPPPSPEHLQYQPSRRLAASRPPPPLVKNMIKRASYKNNHKRIISHLMCSLISLAIIVTPLLFVSISEAAHYLQNGFNNNNAQQQTPQQPPLVVPQPIPMVPQQVMLNTQQQQQQQQDLQMQVGNMQLEQAAPPTPQVNLQHQQQQQQHQQQQLLMQQQQNDLTSSASQQQPQMMPSPQRGGGVNGGVAGGSSPPQSSTDRDGIFRYQGMALNSTTVKLVWNLLSGYHADYFNINWGPIPDGTHTFSVSKLDGTARDYTFYQLQPDTYYQFELHGINGDRFYKPQLVAVRTPPVNHHSGNNKNPLDYVNRDIMPLGVKAEAKSNNSIQLSWTEPDKPANIRNSIKVNFIRYYINPSLLSTTTTSTDANNNNNSNQNNNLVGGQEQLTPTTTMPTPSPPQYHYLNVTNARESRLIVQKLKPATEYAFAVKTAYYTPDMKKIFTQSGYSMDTAARTHDIEPSAPRNFSIKEVEPPSASKRPEEAAGLLSGGNLRNQQQQQQQQQSIAQLGESTSLELTWLPPEYPNGQLKGYVILYAHESNISDKEWYRINITSAIINNWFVSNIKPGFDYFFKVRAINQRGESPDSEMHLYRAKKAITVPPAQSAPDKSMINAPIPANNLLLLIIICMVAILFLLFLFVSRLACRIGGNTGQSKKARKGSLNHHHQQSNGSGGGGQKSSFTDDDLLDGSGGGGMPKLNGFASVNSSSTVTARMGTLARRRDNNNNNSNRNEKQPDFWISAMGQQPDLKSEKSNSDLNMAMVSIRRDSPQFATTQLAPALPEYHQFGNAADHNSLIQQLHQQQQQQHQSHYHPGHFTGATTLAYDQMDSANASAMLTLTKRQQQQLQKYHFAAANPIQSMATIIQGTTTTGNPQQTQAPSPHQQPPPPPPLNIDQQQQLHHHHHQQQLYGTHQPNSTTMAHTRSLRSHRPTLYNPVSGSFVQSSGLEQQQNNNTLAGGGPPNYNTIHNHIHSATLMNGTTTTNGQQQQQPFGPGSGMNASLMNGGGQLGSNTLQYHPHQTSTLMSRRSTNTLRSFQNAGSIYGQLPGFNQNNNNSTLNSNQPFSAISSFGGGNNNNSAMSQPQQLLQSHQNVINQLNNSTYPSLPLKHVSAVRPQIMSSIEDPIELELAEKEQQEQLEQQQHQQQQAQQQQLQQQPQQQQQQPTIKQ